MPSHGVGMRHLYLPYGYIKEQAVHSRGLGAILVRYTCNTEVDMLYSHRIITASSCTCINCVCIYVHRMNYKSYWSVKDH